MQVLKLLVFLVVYFVDLSSMILATLPCLLDVCVQCCYSCYNAYFSYYSLPGILGLINDAMAIESYNGLLQVPIAFTIMLIKDPCPPTIAFSTVGLISVIIAAGSKIIIQGINVGMSPLYYVYSVVRSFFLSILNIGIHRRRVACNE